MFRYISAHFERTLNTIHPPTDLALGLPLWDKDKQKRHRQKLPGINPK